MTVSRPDKDRRVRRFPASLVFLAAAMTGCSSSDRISVSGRVTRQDGSPVVGSRVIFRSSETGEWASGVTDRDGYYELGTTERGEGIPPGEYGVVVIEDRGDWDSPNPPTIHAKYASPKTSGLSYHVEPGKNRTYNLEVQAPAGTER